MPSETQSFGFKRERCAERALLDAGRTIVERNFRTPGAEIDLIAWDRDVLCFVEVRSRSSDDFGDPAQTVDRIKQRKLIRGAKAFLCSRFVHDWPMVRFDVVSIVDSGKGPARVELIDNAFDAGE